MIPRLQIKQWTVENMESMMQPIKFASVNQDGIRCMTPQWANLCLALLQVLKIVL